MANTSVLIFLKIYMTAVLKFSDSMSSSEDETFDFQFSKYSTECEDPYRLLYMKIHQNYIYRILGMTLYALDHLPEKKII